MKIIVHWLLFKLRYRHPPSTAIHHGVANNIILSFRAPNCIGNNDNHFFFFFHSEKDNTITEMTSYCDKFQSYKCHWSEL